MIINSIDWLPGCLHSQAGRHTKAHGRYDDGNYAFRKIEKDELCEFDARDPFCPTTAAGFVYVRRMFDTSIER